MSKFTLPYLYKPRDYQVPLFKAFDSGIKRACCVWHRRCGKDLSFLNLTFKKMFERVGAYYYFFPEFNQGRRVIWDGSDRNGTRFMDHLPQELRKKTNNQEMKVEAVNGSIFQIIGTDNYHVIRGTNPVGCVFSEFAQQNPAGWDIIRPILNENDGWAAFNTTPLGMNHAYRLYQDALMNPLWFTQLLTVNDTRREDGSPIITLKDIKEEERMGMEIDMIQQEYFCKWEASVRGAYFAQQIRDMREQNRILELPFDRNLLVHTFCDLGMRDAFGMWFGQYRGDWIDLFDYEEHTGEGLQFWASLLEQKAIQKGYRYGSHFAPHDIKVREIGSGKSRLEMAEGMGLHFEVVDRTPDKVNDSIQAARMIFPRVRIEQRLTYAIDCLTQYHKKYDEERKVFSSKPEHDFTADCSDAFQCMALAVRDTVRNTEWENPVDLYREQESQVRLG